VPLQLVEQSPLVPLAGKAAEVTPELPQPVDDGLGQSIVTPAVPIAPTPCGANGAQSAARIRGTAAAAASSSSSTATTALKASCSRPLT
jgi:hypothetical protein